MAGEPSESDDKTEAPTPRRLERARSEGQAPVSQELAGFCGLLGAAGALALLVPSGARTLADRLAAWLEAPGFADQERLGALAAATAAPAMLLLLGIAAMVALPAIASHLMQTGLLVSAAHLAPKVSRISPLAGAKRLVAPETLVAFLKTLVKLAVLGGVAFKVLEADVPRLGAMAQHAPELLLAAALKPLTKVLLAVLVALAVLTVLDVLFTRLRFTSRLRMSRQDMRQEQKETDGDPHLKARLRRIRLERSRKRMMADVKTAAVVVTNPTHFAVALAYERERDAAPKVVAKGMDAVALRIRAEAERHHIPLYENPPLARQLFTIDLGQAIPAEQYQAVAEVIAYVWKVKNRVAAGRAR
jgi:flagellar biosynthetic protein FlhB